MSWLLGISSYLVLWWLVIFAVLPFWVRPVEEGDPGHAAGAPANPRLWRKAAVTTGIAATLWLAGYWAIRRGFLDFRGP